MKRWIVPLVLCLAVQLAAALPGLAQAPTGRHRAAPPEPAEPERDVDPAPARWFFAAGAGVLASGDAFRVRNPAGPVSWQPPGGPAFESDDFVVTLDEDIDLTIAVGRRLGSRAWLRLVLGTGRLGMTALARIGQVAEVRRWDQLDVVLIGLDLEYGLVGARNYPYVLGGAGAVAVRGGSDDTVDQTRFGGRLGVGYHLQLNPVWGLRGEARGTIVSLDFGDYVPPVPLGQPRPEAVVVEKTPHQFWELVVMMHASF